MKTLWIKIAIVVLALTLGFGQAFAQYLPVTVERGDLVVHAAPGLEDEAEALADRALRTLPRIEEDLPDLPRPPRIEIRLVRDTADLSEASPPGRGAPRWAAGVAFPDLGVLVLAQGRGGQLHDVGKTLDHELAHLLLGAAIPDAPRWLHEGFAWQHAPEMDFQRFETLAGMAWFGNIAPLDELERTFPADEAPASRAYAQSYDFVRFLANRGRWSDTDDDGDRYPFRYFLRALAEGQTLDEAAKHAYGAPMDELYQEWRTDLVRRYLLVPAGVFATLLWVLAALLLVLAWRRRRRQGKQKVAQWEQDEAARQQAAAMEALRQQYPDAVISEDDLPDGEDDPERPPPRWMN